MDKNIEMFLRLGGVCFCLSVVTMLCTNSSRVPILLAAFSNEQLFDGSIISGALCVVLFVLAGISYLINAMKLRKAKREYEWSNQINTGFKEWSDELRNKK
ncbi:hypothetical protein KK000_14565 [Enterobacter hormaechei subsp. xiangfangensis]|uniref:hypothetical protein n=1 Tax=Enterobacter hormaechei TaxID=158836 RepID=UPI000B2C0E9F|nr:hypothetical protein [Enterobacter hormaechei]MBT1773456.1 hypothetical protein [Enterobacter hormaechei subsp. xiangfangensis]MDN4964899.1 hypothetical protein [Enterobacter hormaechei]MDO6155176.1 hypothetical protein [Enterobacter hormaechei]